MGSRLTRAIGVVALVLAVAVVFYPPLAAGLQPAPVSPGGEMPTTMGS